MLTTMLAAMLAAMVGAAPAASAGAVRPDPAPHPTATAADAARGPIRCEQRGRSIRCYQLVSAAGSAWIEAYRDSVRNVNMDGPVTGTCEASVSRTVSATNSVSVSAATKAWVIAELEATYQRDLSESVTTGYVTSMGFRVPKGYIANCHRGTFVFRGVVKWWGADGQHPVGPGYFRTAAPAIPEWRVVKYRIPR